MSEIFNDANFKTEVLDSEQPVLVDFYADWCGPCKAMAPAVEEIAQEYAGRVKVGKLNVDDSMQTATSYQVMSIPTLILFVKGQAVRTLVGMQKPAALRQMLDAAL